MCLNVNMEVLSMQLYIFGNISERKRKTNKKNVRLENADFVKIKLAVKKIILAWLVDSFIKANKKK